MTGTREHVDGQVRNLDRLMGLLNPEPGAEEKSIGLNYVESIRARFFSEGGEKGVLCEFIRNHSSVISFRLVGDRLDYVGFKGVAFNLGDQWLRYNNYVEFNRREVRFEDSGIFPIMADYAVDLVAKSLSEKRIPEVEIPLKLAPRHPR